MNAVATLNDARGAPVAAGDQVRILAVSPDPDMDEDDREMIEFMIGSVCEVDRIDAAGQAWVTMWWSCADGVATSSVALEGEQIERVGA
jgi:hypothetical protein